MNVAVIALTQNGSILGSKIATELPAKLFVKDDFVDKGSFKLFVKELFEQFDGLVFIMACGIVVRTIASFLISKTKDPAIVVLDEMGKYAISLLSGHIGGANHLAIEVAKISGGIPIITTATDLNDKLSFDMFAVKNNLAIENISVLKHISSGILKGMKVNLYSPYAITCEMPEYINLIPRDLGCEKNILEKSDLNVVISNYIGNGECQQNTASNKTLYLRPRNLVLGIGCKKDTKMEDIELAVFDFLKNNNRSFLSIKEVSSIELKKDEKGLIDFCTKYQLKFTTVKTQTIKEIEDNFSYSPFVKKQIGVGGVCEAASMIAANNGKLVCQKTCYKGITLALTEEGLEFVI